MAETSEAITAIESVSAKSENSWPSMPFINKIGKNIATLVAVEANSAPVTCKAPRITALLLSMPKLRNLTIFSCTIIAASKTKPTEKAKPASEITFKLRSNAAKVINATINETGIVAAIISVLRMPRKNNQRIIKASNTPKPKLFCTSSRAFLICTDASKLSSMTKPAAFIGPTLSSLMAILISSSKATVLASF